MSSPHNQSLEARREELDRGILVGWDGGNRLYNGPVSPEDKEGQELLAYERKWIQVSVQKELRQENS